MFFFILDHLLSQKTKCLLHDVQLLHYDIKTFTTYYYYSTTDIQTNNNNKQVK